jgi:hypothetical protein
MSEQDSPPQEPEAPAAAPEPEPSVEPDKPADTFKKGMGLLWKAARGVAEEIKQEVEKGGVSDALQQAGRELEEAATHAAKAVESFIDRSGPPPPNYQKDWPPSDGATAPTDGKMADGKMADADVPEDGGVDEETGERRDMRIQVDPDES